MIYHRRIPKGLDTPRAAHSPARPASSPVTLLLFLSNAQKEQGQQIWYTTISPSPHKMLALQSINPANSNHRRGGCDAEDNDDDQDVEPEVDQDVDQEQEQEPEPEPEPGQENEIEQEPEVEGELDQEQEQEHDAEQELDIDHDHDHDEDHDQDGEQDPEVDMLESDLQPAHRAKALDVLASIELKFALLRERVYVKKIVSHGRRN
ncbi:hypothetical protein M378DRAFT_1006706 [Amanita muscaria Koide BX008]|uniref:Uncharacterized protein n=1 Tax=Amanita muscaria (strain Koide BX008) TaxID=946122 RepID=A0A0C2WRU9_AMAMK|nr:hypothetical protein M378DRAFT_1006706 [Amanita muscaria Koide BX008]